MCGYAAHIAAQLGANIIKVKIPTAHLEQEAAKAVYEKEKIPIGTIAERISHVVKCTFDGRRIVIFSGGAARAGRQVARTGARHPGGGGFGSIIGRNSFTRKKEDALKLLGQIMDIYEGK